jgi:2-aminoadipate transaminase
MPAAYLNRPDTIAFTWGLPDPRLFPANELVAATQRVLNREATRVLQYGPIGGDPGLVEALAARASRQEGRTVTADNLLVTNGASQGMALACLAFVNPGDAVLVEVPTFAGNFPTITYHDGEVCPVPMDEDGVRIEAVERALADLRRAGRRAAFLYTIPNFHNPTGGTMGQARRRDLVDLAVRHGLALVEDDVYADLRFEGESLPSLWALDPRGVSLKLGSFSKTLAPGLRCGWVTGGADVITRLSRLKRDGATNPLVTAAIGEYFRLGRFEPHLMRLITSYRAKRDVMLGALAEHCPAGVGWTRPAGGFFVWLHLPEEALASEVARAAADAGVAVLPGTACFPGTGGEYNLRLAFSAIEPAQIAEGIARLGAVLRGFCG